VIIEERCARREALVLHYGADPCRYRHGPSPTARARAGRVVGTGYPCNVTAVPTAAARTTALPLAPEISEPTRIGDGHASTGDALVSERWSACCGLLLTTCYRVVERCASRGPYARPRVRNLKAALLLKRMLQAKSLTLVEQGLYCIAHRAESRSVVLLPRSLLATVVL
jgi:hypothetical protein